MKKVLSLLIVALLISTAGVAAFAEDGDLVPDWFKDMLEWRKGQIDEAVENGTLTEEQAEYWREQFDSMEEYHTENGFQNRFQGGYGTPGGCHGGGYGRGPRFNNSNFNNRSTGFGPGAGRGYGPGMMNGGSWGNSYQ